MTTSSSPGWSVTRTYDEDDNVTLYNGATIERDALGRITYQSDGASMSRNYYDGMGHVIQADGESSDAITETFRYNANGNRTRSTRTTQNPPGYGDNGVRLFNTSRAGQVQSVQSDPALSDYAYSQRFEYDAMGNATSEAGGERKDLISPEKFWESASYYSGGDKLRVFNLYTGNGSGAEFFGPGQRHAVWEQYFYDALGRRVFVRSRHERTCSVATDSDCASVVKRYVWDGAQVLHEIRAEASDSTPAYVMDGDGTVVTYTHVTGIDVPAAVMKSVNGSLSMIVPHLNYRGVIDSANAVLGALPKVPWPGSSQTLDQAPNTRPHQAWEWYGDVIVGHVDGSGQKYMRNRYYDPRMGTFTQKDPIGLAGGLNLYGYAGGDPVTYSDPFGLCAEAPDSVKVRVTVDCGDGTTAKKYVWAHRVSEADSKGIQKSAERLTGGSEEYSPTDVNIAYEQLQALGGVYSFPTTVDGHQIMTGGATCAACSTPYVAFRTDALALIVHGNLGAMVGNRGINAANVLGHELSHLLGSSERKAYALKWGLTKKP